MSTKGSISRVTKKKQYDENHDLIKKKEWNKKGTSAKSRLGRVTRYVYSK